MIIRANQGNLPPLLRFYANLPLGDKVGHGLLMGTLSFLVNWAWQGQCWRWRSWPIPKGSVVVLAIVTLEELSQGFIPSRSLSWSDWFADLGGIVLGGWLAVRLTRSRP
ncbi:hypothetical protein PROH_15510 [Prochlorothrix hollandica PCC 9006 = CALU 1027]|uniref:VanZ-like domain-containing protein n=1 Tax=Prochlorothrix hollandica PCC 9006 = CALU 1027 TaxID=317619 RepID=A0A0M2PYD4_PROHO|nr:hypothetical protein PROH_15510 [Prochlorothrix hollandica PCC 9006 = CALU 1027]